MSKPNLQAFTQSMLTADTFPGVDAATLFLPDGQTPAPEIQKRINQAGQARYYPVPGGYLLKIPAPRPDRIQPPFSHEPKGWDHEHCDFWKAIISIGQTCYSADLPSGGFVLFCAACREKLPLI